MTESRESILRRLPRAGGRRTDHPGSLQPNSAVEPQNLLQQLKRRLEAVRASVDIVHTNAQIEDSVAAFLSRNQCTPRLAITPVVEALELSFADGVEISRGEDYADVQSVMTSALLGIAETGTLVLPSSPERPTLANFLPDNCIVLLDDKNIVPWLEDALTQVREQAQGMPRALNLVSGPSKTADIEQTMVYGAHGPIRLHVIIRCPG